MDDVEKWNRHIGKGVEVTLTTDGQTDTFTFLPLDIEYIEDIFLLLKSMGFDDSKKSGKQSDDELFEKLTETEIQRVRKIVMASLTAVAPKDYPEDKLKRFAMIHMGDILSATVSATFGSVNTDKQKVHKRIKELTNVQKKEDAQTKTGTDPTQE